jgi:hypothetical protein
MRALLGCIMACACLLNVFSAVLDKPQDATPAWLPITPNKNDNDAVVGTTTTATATTGDSGNNHHHTEEHGGQDGGGNTTTTAVICMVAKGEEAYIDEFVDYHFGLGFVHVYVYDNSQDNDLKQWGDAKNKALLQFHSSSNNSSHPSVDVKHFPQQSPQSPAYLECAKRALADGHTYAAFIDGDEFIVLLQHTHIVSFLNDYCNRDGQGALALHWRVMGTGGQEVYSPQPLTKRFRYRTALNGSDTIKSIARLEHVDLTKLPHAHYPQMKAGYKRLATSGKRSTDHRSPEPGSSLDVAVIYHYSYKSYREYLIKRSVRGRATVNATDASHAGLIQQAKEKKIPVGVVRDDTAWEAMKLVVPKYRHYDELFPDEPFFDPLGVPAAVPTSSSDATTKTAPDNTATATAAAVVDTIGKNRTCAINLHGAARSFADMALPSIIANIVQPNAKYGCDYFVHFHNIGFENRSRSGFGGELDPSEVYQLKDAVLLQQHQQGEGSSRANRPINVAFSNSTEQEIRSQHADLILKIKTEKDAEGFYIYHPTDPNDALYNFETTTNVVKMWHNLESVWKLMESYEQKLGIQYDQVAMVRLDSLYLSPIDVFYYDKKLSPEEKWDKTAVIPGFAKFPINDRFVYGPREAVHAWANRFDLIEYHIENARAKHKVIGLHSEHFLHKTVFPLLRERGYTIAEDDEMCFLRTRADNVVWAEDCKHDGSSTNPAQEWMNDIVQIQEKIEKVVGRNCSKVDQFISTKQLQCST